MPKKIRELKSLLVQAGFTYRPGKGSHTNWFHPLLPGRITLSAKTELMLNLNQEKDVNNALQKLEEIEKEQEEIDEMSLHYHHSMV